MRNPKSACFGIAASIVLLAVFFFIQSRHGNLLELPIRYLFVSLVPIVVGFVMGGYLKKVKTPIIEAEMENLPEAPQQPKITATNQPAVEWQLRRAEEYARTNGYMLAHVYRPSSRGDRYFDIFIFIVRHKKGSPTPPKKNLPEIQKAEFFFGESWGNRIFPVTNTGAVIGIRTHAWGTFLATCRVTFTDDSKSPIILHRYIDFSMAVDEAH